VPCRERFEVPPILIVRHLHRRIIASRYCDRTREGAAFCCIRLSAAEHDLGARRWAVAHEARGLVAVGASWSSPGDLDPAGAVAQLADRSGGGGRPGLARSSPLGARRRRRLGAVGVRRPPYT
jgi:hypothetical protein